MSTIGERIKEVRKNFGKTQVELGQLLGISGAAISQIESNNSQPTEAAVKLICATYHVHPRWRVTGEGPRLLDDAEARIDRLVEQYAPNADAVFKAQVKAYGAMMSEEDWIVFRDIVEKVRQAAQK